MSVDNPAPNNEKTNFLPAILVTAGLIAAVFFATKKNTVKDGSWQIRNVSDYKEASKQGQELTRSIFIKFDQGKPLSAEELAKVQKASKIYDNMAAYASGEVAPHFLGAKCMTVLGLDGEAKKSYELAIKSGTALKDPAAQLQVATTCAEASYQLALIYLKQKDFNSAYLTSAEALKVLPQNPQYLVARAQAEIQLNKLKEAQADLELAVKVAPNFPRAASLLKFIKG